MGQGEEPRRARETRPPLFQEGEYVVLTQPYLGLPAESVGEITKVYIAHPPRYLVYFGESLPVGSYPETVLAPLKAPWHRKRV